MSRKINRSMEDQLRQAIRRSGMPQNKICQSAKMDEGTLSCFMLGKQESMRLKTAQRLARVLGLRLVLEDGTSGNGRSLSHKRIAKPRVGARRQ